MNFFFYLGAIFIKKRLEIKILFFKNRELFVVGMLVFWKLKEFELSEFSFLLDNYRFRIK